MNCLHLIQRYWPAWGGSEKFFIELSERLAAEGNDVTVFTTDAIDIQSFWLPGRQRIDVPSEVRNGVQIHRFKVRRFPRHPKVLRVLSRIPGLTAKSLFSFPSPLVPGMLWRPRNFPRFDIVHATALPYDSILWAAARIAGGQQVPLVISPFFHLGESRGDDVSRHYTRPHQLRLVKSAKRVFVQTEIEREFLASTGYPLENMVVLGMGINPGELEGGRGERFRRKYDVTGPIVCYIGPRTYEKGTFTLVEAMELLWREGVASTLVLAGAEADDFRNFRRGLADTRRANCLILDSIAEEDKRDLLDAAELLVLPSRSDSFGIVFLESWFYGKPVVGARAGGIPGVVRDGVDGLLVRFGQAEELAVAIRKLLVDREYARQLGGAGRARVLAEFTWDKKYAVVKGVYGELIGHSGASTGR